jgi:hypothetical protein
VIFYKLDEPDEEFNLIDVDDWKQNSYTITGQQTFRRYLIKVEAHNELGESNEQPRVITGFSGEDSEYINKFLLALSKTALNFCSSFRNTDSSCLQSPETYLDL